MSNNNTAKLNTTVSLCTTIEKTCYKRRSRTMTTLGLHFNVDKMIIPTAVWTMSSWRWTMRSLTCTFARRALVVVRPIRIWHIEHHG